MHCELYIPDFFPRDGLQRAESAAAAETLIARGRRRRTALVSREAWLFGRFGVPRQRDWPVAPYTLLADGGEPGPHYWMRADPVHLQVGRDSLVLADSAAFEVSRAESESLVETLNRLERDGQGLGHWQAHLEIVGDRAYSVDSFDGFFGCIFHQVARYGSGERNDSVFHRDGDLVGEAGREFRIPL